MKFTSEDLMKAMCLSIGDKIKVNNKIYTIAKSTECEGAWVGYEDDVDWHNLQYLVNGYDYEILPRLKRVGDLTCNYYKDCDNCPLRILFCDRQTDDEDTLYDILNRWNNEYVNFDQEIYDLFKARLDVFVDV